QPEMTMVHQELDAVLFEGDGIRVLDWDQLLDLEVGHIQLEAARSTFVRAHLAADSQRRFLGQVAYPLKELRRNGALHHHTLNQARAVAEERKQKLAALSQVIEPPLDKNFLANVIRYASNLNRGNQGHFPRLVWRQQCRRGVGQRASGQRCYLACEPLQTPVIPAKAGIQSVDNASPRG